MSVSEFCNPRETASSLPLQVIAVYIINVYAYKYYNPKVKATGQFSRPIIITIIIIIIGSSSTVNPRYNDSIYSQRRCH